MNGIVNPFATIQRPLDGPLKRVFLPVQSNDLTSVLPQARSWFSGRQNARFAAKVLQQPRNVTGLLDVLGCGVFKPAHTASFTTPVKAIIKAVRAIQMFVKPIELLSEFNKMPGLVDVVANEKHSKDQHSIILIRRKIT